MLPQTHQRSSNYGLLWALLALIALALAYIQLVTPYYGDDLTYLTFGSDQNWRGAFYRHWDWHNGRIANLLLAWTVRYLPKAVGAIAMAVATVWWMWSVIRLSLQARRPSATASVLLVTVILLAFPWWDNFLMLAIEFNYIVASLLGLLFLEMLLRWRVPRVWLLPAMALAAVAGAMHEAQSVAIGFGLAMYGLLDHRALGRSLSRNTRTTAAALMAAFAVGALLPLTSPALTRALLSTPPATDGPWWLLMVCSCPLAVLLAVCVAVSYLYNVVMRYPFTATTLGRLTLSEWSVYALAAMISLAIVAVGGVIGRSGWFGNTFALIALVRMVYPRLRRMPERRPFRRLLTTGLSVLIIAHLVAWAEVQSRLGRQTRAITEAYARSQDGLVYSDFVLDAPRPWYLLGKAVTMPLPGEIFKTYTFSHYYGSAERPLLVIPMELAPWATGIPPRGWELRPELPAGASEEIHPQYSQTRIMTDTAGQLQAVSVAGARGYLISPWPKDLTISRISEARLKR